MSESRFVSRNDFVYPTPVESKTLPVRVQMQAWEQQQQRPTVVTSIQDGCRAKPDCHNSTKQLFNSNGTVIFSNGTDNVKVTYSEIPRSYRESCRYKEHVIDDRVTSSPDSTETVVPVNPESTKDESAINEGQETEKTEVSETKPPMSYIGLISKAILQSPDRRMNLGAIYTWMEANFPYFRKSSRGWRNSVRHNLSLNDCFIKAGRCEDGKGNYWTVNPENLQDFIRGDFRLRRRTRRRGRKTENGPTEIVLKATFPTVSQPTGPLYVPSNMSSPGSYTHSQPYPLPTQEHPTVNYSPTYNLPYQVFETTASPHGSPIPSYAPWPPQPTDPYMDCFQPGGHGYGNNVNHFYGYKNCSYPSYGYQTPQW